MSQENNELLNEDGTPKEAATAEQIAASAEAESAAQTQAATPEPPKGLSDEEFLAEVEKRTGRKVTSVDELKAPKPEPTEEEKKKELTAKDKKLLDLHIENGGTVESFVQWKGLSVADEKDLSLKKTIAEYKEQFGMTEEEARAEIKNRYYQLTDEEIEELDEEDKSAAIKKRESWGKRLFSRANTDKQNSTKYLQSLEQTLNDRAYEAEVDAKLEAQADTIAKTFNRKMIVELGEFNGTKLNPIEHTISEEDLTEVVNQVKNKKTREELLYNEDGSEKVDLLIELLTLKKTFNSAIKKAEQEGNNRAISQFEKVAPRNPRLVEAGGNARQGNIGKVGKAINAEVSKY